MGIPRLVKRLRISLLTLLLLTTIFALGLTIWRLNQEIAPLRQEVLQHRDTLGILNIEEHEKIHAIRLRREERYSAEPLIYQFRVFLPEDKRYLINHVAFNIPEDGMPNPAPKPYAHHGLAPGESLITVLIERDIDRKTGKPQPGINVSLNIEAKSTDYHPRTTGGSSIGISEAQNDWIVNKKTEAMCFTQDMIGRNVEQYDANETVVLLRIRAGEVTNLRESNGGKSWHTEKRPEPCDGFMLWIEPEKQ